MSFIFVSSLYECWRWAYSISFFLSPKGCKMLSLNDGFVIFGLLWFLWTRALVDMWYFRKVWVVVSVSLWVGWIVCSVWLRWSQGTCVGGAAQKWVNHTLGHVLFLVNPLKVWRDDMQANVSMLWIFSGSTLSTICWMKTCLFLMVERW